MLSRVNGVVPWMEEEQVVVEQEEEAVNNSVHNEMVSLSTFKSMLEDDWYTNTTTATTTQDINNNNNNFPSSTLLFQQQQQHSLDSSSSCSPSSVFSLDHHSHLLTNNNPFLLTSSSNKSCLSSLLSFDNNAFVDLSYDPSFLPSQTPFLLNDHHLGTTSTTSNHFMSSLAQNNEETSFNNNSSSVFGNFVGGNDNNPLMSFNRSKVLRPLEISPQLGAQPTLFQKRAAALRQNSDKGGNLIRLGEEGMGKRKKSSYEDEDDLSMDGDGSGFNYDSDEGMGNDNNNNKVEENSKNGGGNNSNANSTITGGDQKGKKKGPPAKNLMAERRRRKKLNDRLYMLRSVVPKISKMDRASILGDAIEYLKELLQRINDLHNELESTPPGSSLPPSTSFHPLTPTPPTLPCRVKEELCSSSFPSPNNQPARVEVRMREGRAVNIHMFCSRRPGLLMSTMKALDDLGLDIQQAVISCFDGFALDVFRAEQGKEVPDALPETIKAVLLNSAGYHGVM
ncbi:hypothetical protein IFM89_007665 [Coptis chinensis]|uniref:BHLH domain-containing protein n=1 Tax=Coptis chinensis TaxID=261450 RepID=A0A835HSF0_9MAGN|nr:hypothetical protein IFM89_007665 [Coptis chinensis]